MARLQRQVDTEKGATPCDRCDHAGRLHYAARDLARPAPPLCSAVCLGRFGAEGCSCDIYVPASWRRAS